MPTLIQSITVLLTEAYPGPPDPSTTWFVDNEPDAGILGLLAGVSAAEASTSVDGSGRPGTTIAANAEHLRWSLANADAALRGAPYNPNWKESWNVLALDEGEWQRLRQALRQSFESLLQAVQMQDDLQGDTLLGVLGMIPHAAYHLGSIRQMIERVRSAKKV
jgi:hypothetical protein